MMEFIVDDLTNPKVVALLTHHIEQMTQTSPPESRHVFNVDQLKSKDITFWTFWENQQLMGCAALRELSSYEGEIKSMKVAPSFTRQGVGQKMLKHIFQEAKKRKYKMLLLETGSMAYFAPARKLYEANGFEYCEPFANYFKDDNNVFMRKDITD